jgi:DNA-binding LacI/PurR family transcriptional regulator
MAGIKEVAAHAGVSTTTVSHVINRTRFVAAETVERVERAIAALGYWPNRAARALAHGSNSVVGLIISDITNPFFPDVVKGFENAAIARGWDFFLMNTNYDPQRMAHCVERMASQRVKGVAIMTSEFPRGFVDRLRDYAISVVGLDIGKVEEYVSNISIDYEDGIRQATEHLAAMGHRSIGFICGPDRLKSHFRRRTAFEKNAKKLGMQFKVVRGEISDQAGEAAVDKLLTGQKPVTAMMTASDLIAFGVLRRLHTLKRIVPEQVSLIGFDDILFASVTQPALTTIAILRKDLGQLAAEALYSLSADPSHTGIQYQAYTRLVIRSSTAPPPASRRG